MIGRKIIDRLQLLQIGETIRDLGMEDPASEKDTYHGRNYHHRFDTNAYFVTRSDRYLHTLLMIITCVWMGAIGFLDDYLKIKYRNKEGLKEDLK